MLPELDPPELEELELDELELDPPELDDELEELVPPDDDPPEEDELPSALAALPPEDELLPLGAPDVEAPDVGVAVSFGTGDTGTMLDAGADGVRSPSSAVDPMAHAATVAPQMTTTSRAKTEPVIGRMRGPS